MFQHLDSLWEKVPRLCQTTGLTLISLNAPLHVQSNSTEWRHWRNLTAHHRHVKGITRKHARDCIAVILDNAIYCTALCTAKSIQSVIFVPLFIITCRGYAYKSSACTARTRDLLCGRRTDALINFRNQVNLQVNWPTLSTPYLWPATWWESGTQPRGPACCCAPLSFAPGPLKRAPGLTAARPSSSLPNVTDESIIRVVQAQNCTTVRYITTQVSPSSLPARGESKPAVGVVVIVLVVVVVQQLHEADAITQVFLYPRGWVSVRARGAVIVSQWR